MILKFCFIDTETTGIDTYKSGLIQLSGSIDFYNTETNEITNRSTFDLRISPFETDVISEEALKVTGYSREQIVEFAKPTEAHQTFIDIISTYIDKFDKSDKMFFIGYNARFDADILRSFFSKCGDKYFGSWFFMPPIDVMNMAILRLLDKRSKMADFKLGTVAKMFGLEPEGNLHDAMVDIDLTKKLFLKFATGDWNGRQN